MPSQYICNDVSVQSNFYTTYGEKIIFFFMIFQNSSYLIEVLVMTVSCRSVMHLNSVGLNYLSWNGLKILKTNFRKKLIVF